MAGRPPKPTALKRLTGNPGKRKLNVAVPLPDPSLPLCPEWLREDAKVEWDRLAPLLHQCGILTAIDRDALAAYCQAFARWKQVEIMVEANGQVLKSAEGSIYINPALGASSMAMKQMIAWASKLGLTPVDREKLHIAAPRKEKTLAEFLFENAKSQ